MGFSWFATSSENKEVTRSLKLTKERLFPPREIDETLRVFRPSERNVLDVVFFLTRHPRLLPVLAQAKGRIAHFFGGAQAYLELERDPEDGSEELFCVVLTDLGLEDALKRLGEFDVQWLLAQPLRTRRLLNFTVESQR